MSLYVATVAAMILAALSSVPVAWRRPRYRPVAAFLMSSLMVQFLREQLILRVIRPAKSALSAQGLDPLAVPLPPAAVWAGHVEHALYLGWVVGVAALSVLVFLRDDDHSMALVAPIGILVVGWATFTAILVLAYPAIRGHAVEAKIYRPVEVASLAIAIGSILAWLRRRSSPQIEHAAPLLLVSLQSMTIFALVVQIGAPWRFAQVAYLVLYGVLSILHGGFAWSFGSSRARS